MSGLNCSSIDVLKYLEGLQDLKNLYIRQYALKIGWDTAVLDFSNTGLTYASIKRNNCKFLFSIKYDIYYGRRWWYPNN